MGPLDVLVWGACIAGAIVALSIAALIATAAVKEVRKARKG